MQPDDLYREGRILFEIGNYTDAAGPLWQAAEAGNADAQNDYGFLCKTGNGVPQDLALAQSWYEKGAEQGHPDATHNLAVLFLERDGEAGVSDAVQWLKINAAQGHANSQLQLAHFYRKGTGVEADLNEALRLFRAAADQGQPDAIGMASIADRYGVADHRGPFPIFEKCEARANDGDVAAMRLLGGYSMLGYGCSANAAAARQWIERAAAKDDVPAKRALGLFVFDEDPSAAAAHWETAAAAGDAYSQYLLALSLLGGDGIPRDPARAIQLLESAADQGFVDALVVLSDHYRVGDVIPQDMARAVVWGTRAAQAGHRETQNTLGVILANGTGVDADVPMGIHWLETSAALGWADAQCEMGVRYLLGNGVEKDEKKGTQWLRSAAEQEHTNAMHSLGICYMNGDGVPADPRFGAHCWRKAAALGHEGAAAGLAQLGG